MIFCYKLKMLWVCYITVVSKTKGRAGQPINIVVGGTVAADDSTNEWLSILDQKVVSIVLLFKFHTLLFVYGKKNKRHIYSFNACIVNDQWRACWTGELVPNRSKIYWYRNWR